VADAHHRACGRRGRRPGHRIASGALGGLPPNVVPEAEAHWTTYAPALADPMTDREWADLSAAFQFARSLSALEGRVVADPRAIAEVQAGRIVPAVLALERHT
jgi:hypothetical protein